MKHACGSPSGSVALQHSMTWWLERVRCFWKYSSLVLITKETHFKLTAAKMYHVMLLHLSDLYWDPLPSCLFGRCQGILLKELTWELFSTVLYFPLDFFHGFKYVIYHSGTSVQQLYHMNSVHSLLQNSAVRSVQSLW